MGRRYRRGSPLLVVAEARGKRHHIPRRMTAPESSQRAIQWVPHLSLAALADLRELGSGMPGILCFPTARAGKEGLGGTRAGSQAS